MFGFAKVMCFDEKDFGNKNYRKKSLMRLLESLSITVSASGASSLQKKKPFSGTKFSSSDLHELCDRIKLILQDKQAGKKSHIFKEKIVL